jgi:hypothetical protein
MKPLSQKDIVESNEFNVNAKGQIQKGQKYVTIEWIKEKLAWAKSWSAIYFNHDEKCQKCNCTQSVMMWRHETLGKEEVLCYDCLLSRAFGKVTK